MVKVNRIGSQVFIRIDFCVCMAFSDGSGTAGCREFQICMVQVVVGRKVTLVFSI